MNYADLRRTLTDLLGRPSRFAARIRRYSSELSYGRHRGPAPSTARLASVVLLLYPRDKGWSLPLILRPDDLANHAGQISLPGGVVAAGEGSRAAALRELEEELGVEQDTVDVLGQLSPSYIFASNHMVTPWLAMICSEPDWRPNPAEVRERIELPLTGLQEARLLGMQMRSERGVSFQSPYFAVDGHVVWGATCIMLGELAELISGETNEPPWRIQI